MSTISDILTVTTPYLPGYKVKKVLGLASGLTARTRGFGGKFVAGFQSLAGGEVTAFTVEDKAWVEALQRLKENGARLGANAVVDVNAETTEVFQGTVLVSATGTAVILELEYGLQSPLTLRGYESYRPRPCW